MAGRPRTRTHLAKVKRNGGVDAILALVASGKTLVEIAGQWGVSRQLLSHVANADSNKDRYARARREAAAALAEQSLEIADQVEEDPNALGKAKLQVDTRRWMAARMDPETWAERQQPQVAIQINGLHTDSLRSLRRPLDGEQGE
jgi:hypothetical protein